MKTNKKSPFTGGAVELCAEQASTRFRNELYSYTSYYYRCVDTGRTFSDNELDDKSLEMVYSQYRIKHGIPTKDEIKEIRVQYGLSALAMSRILGLGDNQYRLYEDGAMPTESVGRLIRLARQKKNMITLLEFSKAAFSAREYNRFHDKVMATTLPVVLSISTPIYSEQSYSSYQGGNAIAKAISKHIKYKADNYANAGGF